LLAASSFIELHYFWPSWPLLDAASFALLYPILPFLIKELQGP